MVAKRRLTNFHNLRSSGKKLVRQAGQVDMTFKPLPFHDQLFELISPGLISNGSAELEFSLTINQADTIAMSPDVKHILLRFCHINDPEDQFPVGCTILVNGAKIIMTSQPNARPAYIDITKYVKLCPYLQNIITVQWTEHNKPYVINAIVTEKVGVDILIQRIKDRGLSDPEKTRQLIVDSDNEVATTNLQSSLNCPLGKMRMTMPCKSSQCQHIPCFDALCYLQMNERKESWICPICYKPAYYCDLMIDGFFMDILANSAQNVTEVTLNLDGSWSPVMKTEQPASASSNKSQPEIITISDDED